VKDSWRSRFSRLNLLLFGLIVVLAVCWGRLFCLQVLSHKKYEVQAQSQHRITIPIPAQRGMIYDRNGHVLASSITVRSVCLNPREIAAADCVDETAFLLAKHLKLSHDDLVKSITENVARGSYFMWVKRRVSQEEEDAMSALKLRGVYWRDEQQRIYPNGKMLAPVIGFTGIDQHGLAGTELSFDATLAGADGSRQEARDGNSQPIFTPESVYNPAANGNNVVLTIDLNIQDFLETAVDRCQQQYAPKGVIGVVLDPHTGEVLALAERPTFDPNDYDAYPSSTWKVRAVTDPFEPGSMFKPFVFSGALDENAVRLDDMFNCSTFRIGKRTLHDAHMNGSLTARYIVVKSSNIGMAQIGLRLGIPKTFAYVTSFGFGQKTGIELSSESPGRVQPLRKWSGYTITSVPMGHEISVTAMQVAAGFSAFANNGVVVKPHILRGVIAPNGAVLQRTMLPDVRGRIITPGTADVMLTDVLHKVVKEGTGRLADLEDYEIAGKTGTAQKLVDGAYSHNKYVSSFVCTGPIEDPRAIVLIVVDEPTRGASFFGGTAAAPYASEVLKATLDYMYIDGRRRAKPAEYASVEHVPATGEESDYAP